MSTVITPLSNAVSISTANNVAQGTVIYILNNSNQSANILFSYANGVQYASLNIDHQMNLIVNKDPTDTLTGAAGIIATSIAWPKG